MAYIYKIENKINNKIYIGKTLLTIEKRFKKHKNDSTRERNLNRPLYRAMNKYGIDNFEISMLEECENLIANEREIFFIEQYESFKYGYNATIGGDGKQFIDYDLVVDTYRNLKNITKTAKSLNICISSVKNILSLKNIPIEKVVPKGISVNMYSLDKNYIASFASSKEAARYIIALLNKKPSSIGGVSSQIMEVCRGKRHTAYKHYWELKNE